VKILTSDKVFFHFFQNILNGHCGAFVAPLSHFLPFYRISQGLPSKKLRKVCGVQNSQKRGWPPNVAQDRQWICVF